mmetsp:Transcript_64667/g.204412  ORF Transcript_64667/g.204412 Transcript_64667/m.204412 type:complete len:214 (+) Transcript_64667:233-874(+)
MVPKNMGRLSKRIKKIQLPPICPRTSRTMRRSKSTRAGHRPRAAALALAASISMSPAAKRYGPSGRAIDPTAQRRHHQCRMWRMTARIEKIVESSYGRPEAQARGSTRSGCRPRSSDAAQALTTVSCDIFASGFNCRSTDRQSSIPNTQANAWNMVAAPVKVRAWSPKTWTSPSFTIRATGSKTPIELWEVSMRPTRAMPPPDSMGVSNSFCL